MEAIGRATRGNAGHRPTLVSIILDGENCWEYYPNGGVDFLRTLYRRVVEHPKITPVRICDYLERYPATDKLGHLFPGSWIQHNFGIWIGHPECNRAWDLLYETREYLVERQPARSPAPSSWPRPGTSSTSPKGATGSGGSATSHSSARTALFDRLFRKHLQNVYRGAWAISRRPNWPGPSARATAMLSMHSEPTSLLNVKVDGRRTYFEWINAGHYVCQRRPRHDERWRRRADWRPLLRLRPPSGSCCGSTARGGPVRERLADVDRAADRLLPARGFRAAGLARPAWQEPIVQL